MITVQLLDNSPEDYNAIRHVEYITPDLYDTLIYMFEYFTKLSKNSCQNIINGYYFLNHLISVQITLYTVFAYGLCQDSDLQLYLVLAIIFRIFCFDRFPKCFNTNVYLKLFISLILSGFGVYEAITAECKYIMYSVSLIYTFLYISEVLCLIFYRSTKIEEHKYYTQHVEI